MRNWSIGAVPNVLDTATFQPRDRGLCRTSFNLPADKRIRLARDDNGRFRFEIR